MTDEERTRFLSSPEMRLPDEEAIAERTRQVKIAATRAWLRRTQKAMADPRVAFEVMAQAAFKRLTELNHAFDYGTLRWVPLPPHEEEPN